jgi:HAD superfamily hydrolase (TIGR01484 family)
MPLRLIALDLDGTTLNNHHKLSERTISTLQRLSSSGVIITIATGRGLDTNMFGYIKTLGIYSKSNSIKSISI